MPSPAHWVYRRGGSTRSSLGKRAVTADTDLRLARFFGLSEGFFLGLPDDYDLLKRKRELGDKLKRIPVLGHSAA